MSKNASSSRRWRTAEGSELSKEVFQRLMANKPLHDLKLGECNNRVDLRGICAPEISKKDLPPFRNWALQRVSGNIILQKAHLEGIDFTGAKLAHLRFFNSRITDCCFDDAQCEDWRLWATDISDTTFIAAELDSAVLGPWYEGRGNTYESVNFCRADMSRLNSFTATYRDCDFSHAKLEKIDFQSSSFIRCRFAGELREVIFWDHGFKTGKPNPNPMEDVDFRQAKLRWVEFRRLNLDRMRFPEDEDHLIIKNYRCVLQKVLAALKDNENNHARRLRAILEIDLKWIGPQQQIGVLCRLDFRERWGEAGEEFAVELLRRAEQECARTLVN